MGARDRGRRPGAARRGARGPFGGQGSVVRVAAGWDGGVRRGGSPSASGDDLDGSSRGGPGREGRRADAARDVLPPRRREPGFLARDLQGPLGPRRGAGGVGEGGHADVARDVRAPRDRGSHRRRLLERVLVRAPGPPDACVVARGARRRRRARVDAPRGRGRDGADLDDHRGVRGGDGTGHVDDRRGRVRGRDGGDARRRSVPAGGGVRRRRDGGAGLRRVERAPRGPDDAGRMPSARRPRCVVAGEPRVRLGRQPAVVARPVRADRAGGRGRGARRRLRPPLEGGGARTRRRRGAGVPAVHAGGDGPRVERGGPRRVLRAHARALARAHDARDPGGQRVRAPRHRRGDGERGSGRPPAHDRWRRREGPAVAADQGGRHRPSGARADERGDHGDRCGDPRRGGRRHPRDRRRMP